MHSSASPYRWALRRLWWVLVLCAAAGAALVPVLDASRPKTYEASSLIVAQKFATSVVALPKYGQALFTDGNVAFKVAQQLHLKPRHLIPNKLRAATPQDSLVFTVTGTDADPARAAALANAGAIAFVAELNKGGPTVGIFTIQSAAQTPLDPVSGGLGGPLAVAVGLLAGTVFGLGLISLFLLVRRPLLAPDDVAAQLELPGLGVLTLPPRRAGPQVQPEDVPGTTRVAREILASGVETVLVVAEPGDAAAREQTARVLALALAYARPVVYLGEPAAEHDVNRAVQDVLLERQVDGPADSDDRLLVVDAGSLADTLTIREARWGVVVVGPAGASRGRFDRVLGDLQHNEVIGVVLYRRRRRRHRVLSAVAARSTVQTQGASDPT